MSTTIVVLKSADDAPAFLAAAHQAGYSPGPIEGLSRHYLVHGVAPEEFALRRHPTVRLVEDGDEPAGEPAEQVISIDERGNGVGNWAAARVIRRRNPWVRERREFPMTATFRSARTGVGVDIYMVDSGCNVSHPEFGGRAQQPWYHSPTYVTPEDSSGHGTSCLSLAGGSTLGVARGAALLSFKFHDASSGAGAAQVLAAMGAIVTHYQRHASADRPAVAFFSWSGFPASVASAVSDLIDAGIPFCAPAGNDLADLGTIDRYPAESDPDGIIVTGSNINDAPYHFWTGVGSAWGDPVDIVAPAQSIRAARRVEDGGGYRIVSGTSLAVPVVAGVIACMLQGYRRLTSRAQVQALKTRLLANATSGVIRPGLMRGPSAGESGAGGMQPHVLPDRVVYLDPRIPFEVIPGLTPRTAAA